MKSKELYLRVEAFKQDSRLFAPYLAKMEHIRNWHVIDEFSISTGFKHKNFDIEYMKTFRKNIILMFYSIGQTIVLFSECISYCDQECIHLILLQQNILTRSMFRKQTILLKEEIMFQERTATHGEFGNLIMAKRNAINTLNEFVVILNDLN